MDNSIFHERPFEERVQKFQFLMEKNPNKIPIIIERHPKSKFVVADKNIKFFTDRNVEFSKLIENIRSVWKLEEKEVLFFTTGKNIVISPSSYVGDLYDNNKELDGFLYIQVNNIKTLG